MCEANGGVVELDHSFVGAGLECRDDPLAISVRGRDQIDRRSSERCYLKQDIEGLAGQPGEAAAEQVLQGLGHRQGSAGDRARVRAYELAPQLQREEGIARRRLLHPGELGARQVEAESLLEQPMHRGQTERADRDPLEPSVRERALELERLRELRGLSQGREETDRLVVQASKRDLDRTRRRRVEPLHVVEGDKDRLLLGQGT